MYTELMTVVGKDVSPRARVTHTFCGFRSLPSKEPGLHPDRFGLIGNRGIKENIIMDKIKEIEREHLRYDVPAFKAGDTVRVHVRIIEGEKERTQIFQGTVLRLNRGTTNASFMVRKISDGVGVERIFPMHSPAIDRIEVVSEGKVRQGRIYYLRNLKGKAARIKSKNSWD
jgi:large subunit ribosomal protein L19